MQTAVTASRPAFLRSERGWTRYNVIKRTIQTVASWSAVCSSAHSAKNDKTREPKPAGLYVVRQLLLGAAS